jgi:hypothetical protein
MHHEFISFDSIETNYFALGCPGTQPSFDRAGAMLEQGSTWPIPVLFRNRPATTCQGDQERFVVPLPELHGKNPGAPALRGQFRDRIYRVYPGFVRVEMPGEVWFLINVRPAPG